MVHPVLYPLATSYSLPSHRSYIEDKARRSMAGPTKEDIKFQIHDGTMLICCHSPRYPLPSLACSCCRDCCCCCCCCCCYAHRSDFRCDQYGDACACAYRSCRGLVRLLLHSTVCPLPSFRKISKSARNVKLSGAISNCLWDSKPTQNKHTGYGFRHH